MLDALYWFSEFVMHHISVVIAFFLTVLAAEIVWYMLLEPDIGRLPLSETRKEQLRLRATMFNNIAVAMFSIGFVTPLVGALYHLISAPALGDVMTNGMGWLVGGIAFHFIGAAVLRGLRP